MRTKITRRSILLISLLTISLVSCAQIGIKAGAGFSDIVFSNGGQVPYLGYETDYLTHNYPLFTYQMGIFGNIGLNKHFDFQPELLFTKHGLYYDMDFIYDDIVNRVYLYYLQLPLVFRYKFSLEKKHHPNLFLGPYFGLNVGSKRIKTYDGNTTSTKVENAKPFDFGLVGGFGYDFKVGSGQIVSEFRVGYSLIDIMDTLDGYIPKYNGPSNLKARNISLTIFVGYRFLNIGKKKKS